MALVVLVVDDEAGNRELLRYLLTKAGHRVVVAEDLTSGLAAVQSEPPDVAVIDVMMPGGGPNLARQIRSRPALAQTPLVAVSAALDQPGVQEIVLDAGFDDFVCLPVEPETIVERIEAVTARRCSTKR
jgi:two-component system phosphate regulon response regulator PhoB